jgi:mono/diheme cytochrome c family protein
MSKRYLTATAAAAAIGASLAWIQFGSSQQADAAPTARTVGNFQLVDQTGFAQELYRLKDAQAVVVVAHANGDATAKAAAKKIAELKVKYPTVEFMMVNSSLGDTRSSIAAEARANGISIPLLDDEHQLVGEMLGLGHAGEAIVLDPKSWKVVYQGAVDAAAAKSRSAGYLEAALADLAAGRAVKTASTAGKGARISFPEKARASEFSRISYAKTIAPILENKCVACHSEGGIAPFAMDSYQKVKGFAPMIAEAIRTDRMPPWAADPHVGTFSNDKALTGDEIKTLVHWIEAGAPRGDGADPLEVERHVAEEWPLGKPDLILDVPAFELPATGIVDYQYPYTVNPLKEGKWLKASTIKAGSRQGTHHILTGTTPEIPTGGRRAGLGGSSLGDYAVGAESTIQPADLGVYVPPGGAVGFQMHYTPFGKAITDRSKIGLYFYKDNEKPKLMMRESVLADRFIKLPPNNGAHREVAYMEFPKDALLYSAFIHAHYRATYSDLSIRYPDGKEEMLIRLPRYDFGWQRYYDFATPISVPAGSKLIASYVYDNSKRNPANPDPNAEVVWGDQSFEEMFFTKLRYRWMDETTDKPTNYDQLMAQTRLLGMLDDSINGKIEKSELRGPLEARASQFDLLDLNKDGGLDATELQKVQAALLPSAE